MDMLRELLPIAVLVMIPAYLWWINKDRNRANTYQRETEHAAEYRKATLDHFARSVEHMDRVEQALERIATAIEDGKDRPQ